MYGSTRIKRVLHGSKKLTIYPRRPPPRAKIVWKLTLTPDSSMSTAEPINEAQNLSSMADDVLRAILARARFDDQAALKRVCKRFLAVITSRAFREERRASGCLGRINTRLRSLPSTARAPSRGNRSRAYRAAGQAAWHGASRRSDRIPRHE